MSAVPEGWVEAKLGEVWCESRARVRPHTIAPTSYIGLEHVEGGTNRIAAKAFSDDVKSAVAVFSQGDVLYGRLRPYLNKVIRPAFAGVASTEFLVFQETPALANALLMHLLSSSDLVAYATVHSAGVNLPRISAERLAVYRFPLAPLAEQHRIVSRIESLFGRLSEGVGALRRAQANLDRYRASVLRAAVEGTLTEQWRKDNAPEESGDLLLARISTAADRFGPPFGRSHADLPDGWASAPLAKLIREPLRNGKSAKASSDGQGVRTLTLSAVTEGDFSERNTKVTTVAPSKVSSLWLKAGDIFVERSNTPELVGLARMYCGPADYAIFPDLLIRVRCDHRISAAFVELCLQSPEARSYFRRRARGSSGSMPKINQTTVAELALPLPPRAEQDEIVVRCRSLLAEAEGLQSALAMASRRAASLRQAILTRAFEGRLVRHDPNDEPASALLEPKPTKPNRNPENRVS